MHECDFHKTGMKTTMNETNNNKKKNHQKNKNTKLMSQTRIPNAENIISLFGFIKKKNQKIVERVKSYFVFSECGTPFKESK